MKILLAEDDATLRTMTRLILERSGYEVVEAEDGQAAWEILEREPIQFLVTDWNMPRMDGEALIRQIRSSSHEHYVYILLLTARGQSEEIMGGLNAGANDYLVKPPSPRELLAHIAIGDRLIQVEQELRAARERLEEISTHDELTGLLNRKGISERLEAELNRAHREKIQLSLVLLSIDQLTSLEEEEEEARAQLASVILPHVAGKLGELLRSYDSKGRWRQDELLMVLPHTTERVARAISRRIRDTIGEMSVPLPDGGEIPLTARLGLATNSPDAPVPLDALLRRADETLEADRTRPRAGNGQSTAS